MSPLNKSLSPAIDSVIVLVIITKLFLSGVENFQSLIDILLQRLVIRIIDVPIPAFWKYIHDTLSWYIIKEIGCKNHWNSLSIQENTNEPQIWLFLLIFVIDLTLFNKLLIYNLFSRSNEKAYKSNKCCQQAIKSIYTECISNINIKIYQNKNK